SSVASIGSREDLLRLFEEAFPETLSVLPDLSAQYFDHPPIRMLSIECSCWRLEDRALLIGDAAHAFWPSYGQGANAAFEDCAVLDNCLECHGDRWDRAFSEFEALRKPNTDAMTRLAEEHFLELRERVADPQFLLRKRLERALNRLAPERFQPLYNMISFTTMPYTEALRIECGQRSIID